MINHANDGLHPELIVLFRAASQMGKISRDELLRICFPGSTNDMELLKRLRGALSVWTRIGLFLENDGTIELDGQFSRGRKESLEHLTDRLASYCRHLVLKENNCLPLWGESAGVSADFVRGIAWLLAQNIYGFPTTWNGGVESVENDQVTAGKTVIQNDTRWNGLRFWSRYLGFASGDSGAFQIDPTAAVRDELPAIFGSNKELPARDFLSALSTRLPVLDFGSYRKEIEGQLNEASWRKPLEGHLSMSLSLALRRLDLDKSISLAGRADTGSSYRLTGRNDKTWMGFETVMWQRGKS
jgi:hypothetical protein